MNFQQSIYNVFAAMLLLSNKILGTNNCTRNGDVRLTGINTTFFVAGRIDLCYEFQWRAVCHHLWDRDDASVVCRQLGVPQGMETISMSQHANNFE